MNIVHKHKLLMFKTWKQDKGTETWYIKYLIYLTVMR